MLALTTTELEHATHNYLQFLKGTRLIPSEPIDLDEIAQAKLHAELAESFEQPVHAAEEKLKAIDAMNFGKKTKVETGAVVCVDGRHFVIGVSTGRFRCEGVEMMGLSQAAPFYLAIAGLSEGDIAELHGREIKIGSVY